MYVFISLSLYLAVTIARMLFFLNCFMFVKPKIIQHYNDLK